MGKKFSLTTFVLFLLLIFPEMFWVCAQNISPGVSLGDSFTYKFSASWESSQPNVQVPAKVQVLNETAFIRVTITEVGGAVVVMNVTRYFKNGTESRPQSILVNILNGQGDGFGLVIAPNCEANTYAYSMGFDLGNAFMINDSTVKAYPFGEREVLHATINQTDSADYFYVFHDIYFDKKTGVMLEWNIKQVPSDIPDLKVSLCWEIEEFNVKSENTAPNNQASGQPFQGLLALAFIIFLILISVLFYRRKIKRSKRAIK